MVTVGGRWLVAGDAVARLHALDQTEVGECLEGAVDRGDPHGPPRLAQAVMDLLSAQAAVLAAEELDDRGTRAAPAVAGCVQRSAGVSRPGHAESVSCATVISKIVLIIVVISVLAGCGAAGSTNGRKTVVAAFYPVAYAAEQLGGTYDVENLTPPGVEPHDLELAPRTVGRIESAAFVLYLGHGFQPAVSTAASQSNGERVDVLAGLPLHDSDPHVWLDPVLYARVVRKIGAVLHRPPGALLTRLQQLDREYRHGLRDCRRHEIVTSHEAFGYLAQRYGLTQVAITGITPESEPSPQRLAQVIRLVQKTHATTVFFERLVSPRLADTVARDAGARTAVLDPIEGQEAGETYFTLMRKNLAALRKALACH
jgi:zinc transport system substrate-binding protein